MEGVILPLTTGLAVGVLGPLIDCIVPVIIRKIRDWLKRREPAELVATQPDESLVDQEQIKGYLKRIEEFLDDDKARVLGIYGMGGIGKTTLLRQVHHELTGNSAGRRFNHLFFITVSHVVDVEKIKRDIKEQIGGNLSSLGKSKFVLLFDNVCKKVDLPSKGIPLPSSENGCKVIMAGRSGSHSPIKHVDLTDVKDVDLTDVKHVDLTDVKHVDLTDVKHVDLTDVEHVDLTDVKLVDLTDVEHVDPPDVKQSFKVPTEASDPALRSFTEGREKPSS